MASPAQDLENEDVIPVTEESFFEAETGGAVNLTAPAYSEEYTSENTAAADDVTSKMGLLKIPESVRKDLHLLLDVENNWGHQEWLDQWTKVKGCLPA